MKYKIFRLCRDKKTIKKIREEERKHNIPYSEMETGIDLYTFIRKIIQSDNDYALICHDDVFLPESIELNIKKCIKSMDEYVGNSNWAIVGNAGVELLSKSKLTFISDPHTEILPPRTERPTLVESIDGNTMLLNIRALQEKNVTLPINLSGFHFYDVVLSLESYKSNLVCAVSSLLYTKHSSSGDYRTFLKSSKDKQIQNYFLENYANTKVTTINGTIKIKRDYKYLHKNGNKKKSIEEIINQTVKRIFQNTQVELHILIRIHQESNKIHRLLRSIEILKSSCSSNVKIFTHLGVSNISKGKIEDFILSLQKEYSNLNLIVKYIQDKNIYPRVQALKDLAFSVESKDNSYILYVDYDDFVFPTVADSLQYILKDTQIVIGESIAFTEKWDDKSFYPESSTFNHKFPFLLSRYIYRGNTSIPICSVIYSTSLLHKTFEENLFLGDYYEDYALLLLASKYATIYSYPILYSGISYHGENTVSEIDRTHWDYSYVTFMSDIINSGVYNHNIAPLINSLNLELKSLRHRDLEFQSFKAGLIWKSLKKYRKIKRKIKSLFASRKLEQ